MNKKVSINGTIYDAETGKILRAERSAGVQDATSQRAVDIHARPQRSQTLQRRYVNKTKSINGIKACVKPAAHATPSTAPRVAPRITTQPQIQPHPTIQKHRAVKRTPQAITHPRVAHFAKATPARAQTRASAQQAAPDIAPMRHAMVQAVEQKRQANAAEQARVVLPSHVIKQQAIESATKQMKPRSERKEIKQPKKYSKFRQFVSTASVALAVMLLGAYFTYLNMPALSTRVAAAQAGINATYPGYQPAGYTLNGPVAYDKGSVTMKFASNGSSETFTLAQTKSNWDSSAVLENYVKPAAGRKYSTATINGLTIYTYNSNAAWVNGGILYTVQGSAQLAPDQIERLAASL